ncbi:MAG TPA: ABC transporter permease [Gemmatimonadaceae bacterium]|nr:ABC transporter permease [Gemmatimonadaceae bacterium]
MRLFEMMSSLIARIRSLWRGVRRREVVEHEMSEEFQAHLDLHARDLVRAGLTPEQAARQARLEFGSTERYKDESRASRGLRRIDALRFSWLDFKLGARMLVKYPGLTLVGGFAIAFAIWVSAGVFAFLNQVVNPTLPFRDGDRIVALQNWDASARRPEHRLLSDYAIWRSDLRSIEDLGAWRHLERNLITGEGRGEPVALAETSASAFRLTRVPAQLGRTLIDADEQPNAAPVLVIGHDLWHTRFAGDSGIVGQTVRVGTTLTTIVGVMPEGFAFPVAHEAWIPFRLDPAHYAPREGPVIRVFGRLASGASLESAQRELAVIGLRAAADFPDTHRFLRPRVLGYAKSWFPIQGLASLGLMSSNLLLVLLLALVCANVALLMFARAATREGEIVVRTALGASRARIVTQLLAEALVLSGLAAVSGLAAAQWGLEWAFDTVIVELMNGSRLPFWITPRLSPASVVYALLLAILAALISGVVPALRVTRGVSERLKQATSGGGGLRFSGVWTAVIVAQIAFSTVLPVLAVAVRRDQEQLRNQDLGFPLERYLSALLVMGRESPTPPGDSSARVIGTNFATTIEAMERRLEAHPAVSGVTFTDQLPRRSASWNRIEVDEGAVAPTDPEGLRARLAFIDPDYFDVLGTPLLAGRAFHAADLAPEGRAVIVNQPFVERILGGKNPIGRRVRYLGSDASGSPIEGVSPWYEIVGVAPDLGMSSGSLRAGVYHPLTRAGAQAMYAVIGVRGDARTFAPALRSLATDVDPELRLYSVLPLTDVADVELRFYSFWFLLLATVSAMALLLSLAGIYAVMAFTVSRRTREIGIRMALGSGARRVVFGVLRRPLAQVAVGVILGSILLVSLVLAGGGSVPSARQLALLGANAILLMLVCLIACVVPARRALSIQPTDALRMDG